MDEQTLLQAIGKMIDEKLDAKLEPMSQQISDIKSDMAALRVYATTTKMDVGKLQRDVTEIREEMDDMHKGINAMVDWLDRLEAKQNAV